MCTVHKSRGLAVGGGGCGEGEKESLEDSPLSVETDPGLDLMT